MELNTSSQKENPRRKLNAEDSETPPMSAVPKTGKAAASEATAVKGGGSKKKGATSNTASPPAPKPARKRRSGFAAPPSSVEEVERERSEEATTGCVTSTQQGGAEVAAPPTQAKQRRVASKNHTPGESEAEPGPSQPPPENRRVTRAAAKAEPTRNRIADQPPAKQRGASGSPARSRSSGETSAAPTGTKRSPLAASETKESKKASNSGRSPAKKKKKDEQANSEEMAEPEAVNAQESTPGPQASVVDQSVNNDAPAAPVPRKKQTVRKALGGMRPVAPAPSAQEPREQEAAPSSSTQAPRASQGLIGGAPWDIGPVPTPSPRHGTLFGNSVRSSPPDGAPSDAAPAPPGAPAPANDNIDFSAIDAMLDTMPQDLMNEVFGSGHELDMLIQSQQRLLNSYASNQQQLLQPLVANANGSQPSNGGESSDDANPAGTGSSSSSVGGGGPAPAKHAEQFASSMLLESMAQAQAAAGSGAPGGAHRGGGARSSAAAFIGNLVPRMQHLLGGAHRENNTNNARITSIMEGLRAGAEIRQAEAAQELAELLLMGNEDSLPTNLPIKEIVGLVVTLLQKEHNYELMLTAARCLTNMLEALPRAQPIVIEAVPYLLEKLKRIECIDVAEASLSCLEVMSRRNGKVIMVAGGIAATISHIDFFPLAAQRLAFSIAANCAMFVGSADFGSVREVLPELTQRLMNEDKRSLDSVCQLFSRLTENLRNHPDKLREIAGSNHCMLSNMQQLLVAQPSNLSSTTFPLVIKILRLMAYRCSDIAVALVQMHFAGTLRFLLAGSSGHEEIVDLVQRPSNQLAELVYLTGELFPRLPTSGIFDIDATVASSKAALDATVPSAGAVWYWKDEEGWQPFRSQESKILEIAKMNGERMLHVSINAHVYEIDLTTMRQTNMSTGTNRELRRQVTSPVKKQEERASSSSSPPEEDRRLTLLQNEPDKMETVIRQLFPVLVEIDGSSSGLALRYESLRVMLRMVCPMPAAVLRGVLADLPLSGHIASALASPRSRDLSVVVAALQLVHMLLEKMADVYGPLFRKEGVAHEIEKLAAAVVPCPSFTTLAGPSSSMSTVPSSSSSSTRSAPSSGVGSPALTTARDKSPSPAVSGARSRGASPAIAAALNGDAVPGPSTPAPVVKARNSRRSGDRAARRSVPSSSASVVASASPSAVSEDFDMAEAPSTSSGATTAAAMPPSGADEVPSGSLPSTSRPWKDRHRKRTSPEGGSAGPGSIGGGAKEKNRRKSSSSFLSALRLPSFRGSPSSSPSSATGSPPAQATPPPIDGGAPSSAAAAMAERLQSRRNLARSPASQERYERFMQQMRDAASGVGLPPGMKAPRAGGHGAAYNPGAPAALGSQLTTAQKDKMRSWIKKEAELLMKTYLGDGAANTAEGDGSLSKLREQAAALEKRGADVGEEPLVEIYRILETESISAFELKHSGLMSALHAYLTTGDNQLALIKDRHLPDRKVRLRRFAKIFMKLGPSNLRPSGIDGCFAVYEQLIQKAITSISLLEQFQVKVTDMGGIATGGNGCLRGAQALRFFQSHQIRCNLRRHPACTELSDWRHGHGSIKIDPLTSVSAIERYLTERGIGFVRGGSSGGVADDSSGEDELSDDEGEGVVAPAANGVEDRKIEIVIGDTPVPSTMTVLQALRQYQPSLQDDGSSNSAAIGQSLWMNTHTIYYRAALQPANGEVSGVASGGSTPGQAPATSSLSSAPAPPKDKKHKVADRIWIDGELEPTESPLWAYLENRLPTNLDDPSAPSILLLRALFGLDRYWYTLFDDATTLPTTFGPLIPMSSFISPKLAGKLSRQLSDFLTVATQQIPAWTVDLVRVAPFLFPFALRRSLMYCTAFGRDRALMHLVSQTDNGGGQEADAGRGLTPRLERKKVSIKRDDLLKSAEAALAACVNSNKPMAMLEVSFEGEAGTGFGPTLEFYSSISKELQLSSLKMWHGGVTKGVTEDGASGPDYVNAPHGLHPIATPYGQKGATSTTSRIKKFELVGRLMAQALVDARMIDLPLSPLFLSWLIGDSHRLGIHDLETLDPHLYSSLRQLTMTDEADFEHLEQYFTLPGSESFELMKGGKNKAVSKANAMHFAKLVAHWRLREGVQREMDAVRRGFCSIVDPGHLSMFSSEELEQLFCGCPDDAGDRVWGEAALAAAIKPDHGYSHDSEQVKWLVRMLASFDRDEQRRFVQFVTGSPRLPVGGFRSLNPPLTIVRKANAYGGSNEELPSAMTCYNYLKVPPYSSYEIFHERFSVALRFVTSFHLT